MHLVAMQVGRKLSMNIPSVSSWSNLSEISDASVEDIENRTEDEISSLTKSILNSAHSDFRTTILNGKLGSDLISKSLGDSSFDVRHAALSYACASLSSDEVSESDKEKIFVSFSRYFEQNADTCSVRESDLLRAGLACLFCYFSGCYSEKDPKRQAAFHKIVLVMDTLRDEGCILVGKSLAILVRSVSYETASELCELSMRSSLDCSKSLQRRRSAAAITSAIIKGLGQTCALRMTMVDNLRNIFNDENGEIAQLACGFNLYSSVCMIAGRSFEPFMFEFSPLIFCAFSNASAEVRGSARIAQASIASSLHNNTITFITPALVQGLTHKSWQNKVRSLVFMGDLSTRAPGFFKRSIPDIFGPLLECVFDTHPKVSASALSILRPICESVTNAELLGMLDLILLAIQYPQNKTEECLDKLMETTFVNSMDAPSLAIILPIILRGLRERAKELKQKAATTCGNICALVDDTRDLLPFISILLPELNKCEEHSHPDLRKCAVKAKESLLKGLDDQNLKGGKSSSSYICDALEASSIKIDPVVLTHVARVGGWMLTVAPLRMPPNILSQDICRELFSILEDSLDYALIEKVAEDAVLAYKGLEASSLNDAAPKDYIVELEGIILAFAGRVLLQRTDFVLERGHTYGIVGQNGTGKTTLLNRVAKKDISNFPQDVSVYYIQHEILSEKQETVLDFMLSSVPDSVSREIIQKTLFNVGFDETKMNGSIQSLSGGWRMKLAIARAMLWDADVLLLDEPTNHLDADAVAWLIDYLKSLTGTTICLVSHDYDFLSEVLSDVIHISEKSLVYYPMKFREFQSLKPEIVAALPSPSNAIMKDGGINSKNESTSTKHEINFAIDNIDASHIKPVIFPVPGNLEGVKSRSKVVMYMKEVSFRYPGAESPILKSATVKITQNSRVAIIGMNGAGKTTLMKLLIGELKADEGIGEVWVHHNLRLAYIAQHSMHHLEESVNNTPLEYLQNRFYQGRDREIAKRSSHNLSKEEFAISRERGNICEVVGRQERGKHLFYECRRSGRDDHDTDWEMLTSLERKDEYVMKMVRNFDEKLKAMQSGMDLRPLTKEEVRMHLENFGIDEDLAMGKIKRMSGGQKSRLVLAAAMWINPHVIALDEPTNYLDNDTLAALTNALALFKGGVIMISHNDAFVNKLCNETWLVGNGVVNIQAIAGKAKGMSVADRRALKKGLDAEEADLKEVQNNSKKTAAERKAEKERIKKSKAPIKFK